MPLYTYRCDQCGQDRDQFNKIVDREKGPGCCGATMAPIITPTMIQVPGGTDISYRCPMTGEAVQSMRRRKYLMEKNGVVDAREYTSHWKQCAQKRAQENAEAKAHYDSLPDAVKKAAQETAPAP